MKTRLEHLEEAVHFLEQSGLEDARASAEALFSHALGCSKTDLYLGSRQTFQEKQSESRLHELLEKRAQHIPLQYLLGYEAFRNAWFKVSGHCLIPRPETELLVERALEVCRRTEKPVQVLDIGTGSGNIAISLALECPQAGMTATDISQEALAVAKENAEKNHVSDRIDFVHTHLFEGIHQVFDLVVSNPPYLTEAEYGSAQPEILFEPKIALIGGRDGLDFYRAIISQIGERLKSSGVILFEVGFQQAQAVMDLLQQSYFTSITVYQDYAGMNRMVQGVKA